MTDKPIYGYAYYEDRWTDGIDEKTRQPKSTNDPVKIDKVAVRGWHVPSGDPHISGMHYVQFDDGSVYERYDCYTYTSPFGWKVSTVDPKPVCGDE